MRILLALIGSLLLIPTAFADVTLSSDTTYSVLVIGTGSTLTTSGYNLTVKGTSTGGTLIYGFLKANQRSGATTSTTFTQKHNFFKTSGVGDVSFTGTSSLILTGTGASPSPYSLTVSGSLNNLTIDNGLVGYWKLDDGSGSTVARDSSRYGNHGTWNGASSGNTKPQWKQNPSHASTFFNPEALEFDGTDDYVAAGSGLNFDAEVTVSAWFNTKTVAAGTKEIVMTGVGNSQQDYALEINRTAGRVSGVWGNSIIITASTTLSTNVWYHAVLVRSGTSGNWTARLYLNGVQDGSTITTAVNPNAANPVTDIGRLTSGAFFFNGLIDDVRIYNRALSASEIRELASGKVSSGSGTYTIGSALDINGDLSMYTGTLNNTGNYNLNVGTRWWNVGTTYNEGTETVTFDGTPDLAEAKKIYENGNLNNMTIDNGLVGYWKLDDGSGSTVARDSSRFGNHGTLTNYTGVQSFTGWVVPTHTGNFFNPSALEGDGTNDYVNIPFTKVTGYPFTLSVWTKAGVKNHGSLGPVVSIGNDNTHYFAVGWQNATGLTVIAGRNTTFAASNGSTMGTGIWTHMVGVFNSATSRQLYVNGLLAVTGTTSVTEITNMGTVRILAAFGIYAEATADDVRIYNRALSASEVAALSAGNPSTGSGYFALGAPLSMNGNFSLNSGTLNLSGFTLNVKGNWQNDGDLKTWEIGKETGSVILNGTNTQTMSGNSVFYNFSATGTNALFMDFRARQSFSGALTLQNKTVRSTKTGSASNILLDGSSGTQSVSSINVKDNDASGGTEISCTSGCTDSGNNTNWSFAAAPAAGGAKQFIDYFYIMWNILEYYFFNSYTALA